MDEIVHCSECIWWNDGNKSIGYATKGYCRGNSPYVIPATCASNRSDTHWPETFPNDYCRLGEKKCQQ